MPSELQLSQLHSVFSLSFSVRRCVWSGVGTKKPGFELRPHTPLAVQRFCRTAPPAPSRTWFTPHTHTHALPPRADRRWPNPNQATPQSEPRHPRRRPHHLTSLTASSVSGSAVVPLSRASGALCSSGLWLECVCGRISGPIGRECPCTRDSGTTLPCLLSRGVLLYCIAPKSQNPTHGMTFKQTPRAKTVK